MEPTEYNPLSHCCVYNTATFTKPLVVSITSLTMVTKNVIIPMNFHFEIQFHNSLVNCLKKTYSFDTTPWRIIIKTCPRKDQTNDTY